MNWYLFEQNNSGGSFDVDKELCHRLFIQAETIKDAEQKAFGMGVYYDGCEDGRDCSCCGDRWSGGDEINFPLTWGKEKTFNTIEEYAQHLANDFGFTKPDARVFYKDGSVMEINQAT